MAEGKIIKGIAGFYYVHVKSGGLYECKARGIFRNKNIKPLVGDNVVIDIVDEENKKGNITELKKRKNELIRPAVANIDQAMVIFAVTNPEINYNLLDRFLVMMNYQNVPVIICFNKMDLVSPREIEKLKKIYVGCGNKVIFTSNITKHGMEKILEETEGRTTVFAGPSGVGKSTLTNYLFPDAYMETGDVSRIGRGRHTTRHSEIFCVHNDTYICDTPGFTSLILPDIEKEELRLYFNEFNEYEGSCRFNGCVHVSEPDCGVKKAVEEGKISKERYESYLILYDELKRKARY